MSIDHKNRRQIFVEDYNDVLFYEAVYSKARYKLDAISLHFIPANIASKKDKNGKHNGGKDVVKEVVKHLTQQDKGGNKTVYGILDWDCEENRKDSEFIKILGRNKRYNMESYIYDPILLAAFLLKEGIIKKQELNNNFISFNDLSNEELQNVVDYIIGRIQPYASESKLSKKGNRVVKYINGKQVNIPKWYLEYDGHDLQDLIQKMVFPSLDEYKKELAKKVIGTIDIISEFIPNDFIDLFESIQNHKTP